MRFIQHGPDIPNQLISQQRSGEVVFLCGAGVSQNAGLLDFKNLASMVMARLGTPNNANSKQLFLEAQSNPEIGLDRVFSLLRREYRAPLVDQIVRACLKKPRNADLSAHKSLLTLSRDSGGRPLLITTNFDLLFEDKNIKTPKWIAPILPSIDHDDHTNGLIYLHGRLSNSSTSLTNQSQLVLSSQDFGRAYLSDGWATKFLNEVISSKTIVLIGYSANDAPMQYLLEGLAGHPAHKQHQIFSFHQDEEAPNTDWEQLGVIPIPYSNQKTLWNSMHCWAERSEKPDAWKTEIQKFTVSRPAEVAPYIRGQVVEFVSTEKGARAFSQFSPNAHPDWINVFDSNIRCNRGGNKWHLGEGKRQKIVDEYALDNDPPLFDKTRDNDGYSYWDLLETQQTGDSRLYDRLSLNNQATFARGSIRLSYIANWITKAAHSPTIISWAFRQSYLHPILIREIAWRTYHQADNEFDEETQHFWELFLEAHEELIRHDDDNYTALENEIKRHGWTSRAFRLLEDAARPYLSKSDKFWSILEADKFDWESYSAPQFEVAFPDIHTELNDISDEHLPQLVGALRIGLMRAATLLGEARLQLSQLDLPNLIETKSPDAFADGTDPVLHYTQFASVFRRLHSVSPKLAAHEVKAWPDVRTPIFEQLYLFAWHFPDILPGKDVEQGILDLESDLFWQRSSRHDLLHCIKSRWSDISTRGRRDIVNRFTSGPPPYPGESDESRMFTIGSCLGWLANNGCALPPKAIKVLQKFREKDVWTEEWVNHADETFEPKGGWVAKDEDTGIFERLSLSEICAAASSNTKTDFSDLTEAVPFIGLVKQRPLRALTALSYEMRHDNFPMERWKELVDNWPESASPRLTALCALRISKLPTELLTSLNYNLPRWIRNHAATQAEDKPGPFLAALDSTLEAFINLGPETTRSAVGEISQFGKPIATSRIGAQYYINGPAGILMEGLINICLRQTFKAGQGLPDHFKRRASLLFKIPGEGGGHAISIATERYNFFHYADPDWFENEILPFFKATHSRNGSAWVGFLKPTAPLPRDTELFSRIRPDLLSLFTSQPAWLAEDDSGTKAAVCVIAGAFHNSARTPYISISEARSAVQHMSEKQRTACIRTVKNIVTNQKRWKSFAKRFFNDIWPKEEACQTEQTSAVFSDLLQANPTEFSFLAPLTLPFLRKGSRQYFVRKAVILHTDNNPDSIIHSHPEKALIVADALIADKPAYLHHNLREFLDAILDVKPDLRNHQAMTRLHDLLP